VDDAHALDAIDRHLIELLGADGRCSVNELAQRAGVGRATAYQRLGRLRERGVIEGFTVRVDPRAMGLGISALLLINVEQRAWSEVRPELRALPGAEWVAVTAGEFDFVMLVRTPDVGTLRDVVLERLQSIPGVRASETVLLLDDEWVEPGPTGRPPADHGRGAGPPAAAERGGTGRPPAAAGLGSPPATADPGRRRVRPAARPSRAGD
jgi:DNA-binding Lrp family transcriptional regulator